MLLHGVREEVLQRERQQLERVSLLSLHDPAKPELSLCGTVHK